MVLRTKIKSEICVSARVFPVAEFIRSLLTISVSWPGPGLTALRDCNNESGPGIERELVTGNSSASEGFPATQQSADPGRNRWLGLTLGWHLATVPAPCHVSCHILRCSPHAAGLRHCFLFFPRPGPGNSGLVSDLSASRGAAGAAHCLQADEAGDQGEECLGPRALRKWQARVGARAMIPGDNGSYQRMSWSDDGLITLTMLIDCG